jgi:hypothetical protein
MRPGHPGPTEPPPFKWADRYDVIGIAVAALLVTVLLLVGASVWLTIALAAAVVNLTSFALRRRAGIPQVTLWQRWRMRRHAPH